VAGKVAGWDGGTTDVTYVRYLIAAVLTAAAVGLAALIGLFWYDWGDTYGADVSIAAMTGLIGGTFVGALLVLARRALRLSWSPAVLLFLGVAVTVAVASASAMAGNTARTTGWQAAAVACDDPVGSDLVELAIASGKEAGGESRPNYGVVLMNGSMTDGRYTGECVAMLNASLDHVMQAAASLRWDIDDGRIVSPNQVVVVVEQEPPEPGMFPLVTMTARR
jgi:hypothetical protein